MRPTLFYSSKILHNLDPVNPLAMKSKEIDQWPNLGKFRQLVFVHPWAIIMQNHVVGSEDSPRFAKGNLV
jgi:hypothetical protein